MNNFIQKIAELLSYKITHTMLAHTHTHTHHIIGVTKPFTNKIMKLNLFDYFNSIMIKKQSYSNAYSLKFKNKNKDEA